MASEVDHINFDPLGDFILVGETPIETSFTSATIDNGSPILDHNPNSELPRTDDLQDAEEDPVSGIPQGEDLLQQRPVKPSIQATVRVVKMRVSSRHLVLASEYFADMIRDCGQSLLTYEKAPEVQVEGDNIEALQILLDIVHGFNRKVPRQVDLHTLCEIIFLIDKYELHEAAEVFTAMWYANLRPTMSRSASSDLGAWIYICSGLEQSADFNSVTQTAILNTNCMFSRPHEARIPHWFISGMVSARLKAVDNIFSVLSELIELYAGQNRVCYQTRDCDALSLGRLIKELKRVRLYPIPESASWTESVSDILTKLRTLQLTPLCDAFRNVGEILCKRCRKASSSYKTYESHWDAPASECDLKEDILPSEHMNKRLEDSLSRILASIHGLSLDGSVNAPEGLLDIA